MASPSNTSTKSKPQLVPRSDTKAARAEEQRKTEATDDINLQQFLDENKAKGDARGVNKDDKAKKNEGGKDAESIPIEVFA
ncbi:hypothetical protein N0V90_008395 [Kalmusia sp. IMI 367209]|nr:hypothetical protein N0V90_008395 [Kalmusia sp. IMI 367209]